MLHLTFIKFVKIKSDDSSTYETDVTEELMLTKDDAMLTVRNIFPFLSTAKYIELSFGRNEMRFFPMEIISILSKNKAHYRL